ncbi:MAG: hypothetical protein JWQ53_1381, partial [Klenkia sp.]|nr:hypothetical protein [Klenkia sp.]
MTPWRSSDRVRAQRAESGPDLLVAGSVVTTLRR